MSNDYTFVADTTDQQFSTMSSSGGTPNGYRAVESSPNRRSVVVRSVSEDRILRDRQRRRLSASGRDLFRNFAIARWAITKHLDYVSNFRFRATTPDEGFNREYEEWVEEVSKAHNFDLAQRHNRDSATRLTEQHRFLDGDAYWAKYAGGATRGRCELVEGDRICDDGRPQDRSRPSKATEWINGVEIDLATGAAINYAVGNRTAGGIGPGRAVRAYNLIAVGYYDRFDQVRGIGPWAAAIEGLKDVDETFDYARAKVKLAQLMGLKFTRTAEGPLGQYAAEQCQTNSVDIDAEAEDGEARYKVDMSGGSVFAVDLDSGYDVEMMESKTPATEAVAFLKLCILVALRACDIPYSFFDESFTNFYGQRGSFLSYIQGVRVRQKGLNTMLCQWTRWRTGLAVADGSLQLPSGWEYQHLSHLWLPEGQPWWDPAKELTATALAIGMGLDSPQAACHKAGGDFERNVDSTIDAILYTQNRAKAKGVDFKLSFDASSVAKGAMASEAKGEGRESRRADAEDQGAEPDDESDDDGSEEDDAGDAEE